jgi:drug/metabolite transporter (DMT)-like permease
VTALAAFYLNVFVLVVQAFLRVPGLHAVAPTQAEPPFAIAQGAVLLFFAVLTVTALRRGPAALTSPSA